MATTTATEKMIQWSVASRPLTGQTVSGDLHVVKFFDDSVLLAVIDGVGHGNEADKAAHVASRVLENYPSESTISLMRQCHEALNQTRGAVITLACLNFEENAMNWLGVGNVEGQLFRADPNVTPAHENILLRGGLVGYQLPSLQASVVPISHGDLLVFATDGVHAGFDQRINLTETPKQ
ncbi:MAG TPA: SpoIIE family protein phosphatase, partial [Candidatus Baltobacteraceae bacterium]|nr:SpoIIE family protein phosphatase [Candidatus Baltobacteraceae bacterium]